jgi:hypothetical protein
MLGIPIDHIREAALMRGMAVLQEYRFQNVSELHYSLYGPQVGVPVNAPVYAAAPPATAPMPYIPTANMPQTQAQAAPPAFLHAPVSTPTPASAPAPMSEKQKNSKKNKWTVAIVCGVVAGALTFALSMMQRNAGRSETPEDPAEPVVVVHSPPPEPSPSPSPIPTPPPTPAPIEEPIVINVTDMPYVLSNAHATIPGIYTGQWSNDAPNGIGEFIYSESGEAHTGGGTFIEGTTLKGVFVNGLLEGFGEFATPDGHHYEGNFVEGMRTGQGKYTWPDGDVAEGEFKNSMLHGFVKYTWVAGDIFEGIFVDDKANGPGRYIFASGQVFEGEYKDDRRHGPGTLWDAEGTIIRQGIWEDGVFQE